MNTNKDRTKSLALLSGGLDSILAIKILQKQGIDVTGISFVSYFLIVIQLKKQQKVKNKDKNN